MWNSIVLVPDHCLFICFTQIELRSHLGSFYVFFVEIASRPRMNICRHLWCFGTPMVYATYRSKAWILVDYEMCIDAFKLFL